MVMSSEASPSYILDSDEEIVRLRGQHDGLIDAIGSLVVPPIDWTLPELRVLDSGTADGMWGACFILLVDLGTA